MHTKWLIPLFRPGSVHSGSACWDNCSQVFPDKSIPWEVVCELMCGEVSTLSLDSSIVSPLQLRWVKGVCVFRCNLPPVLLADWLGSFTCHCSSTGVERTQNNDQHGKLTLEKNIFLLLPLGFELTTFWSWVWCSTNKLSRHDTNLFYFTLSTMQVCQAGGNIREITACIM